ncbi:MAG: FAD-dependent oxidoreductase [Acidimicrobiia bacterium]|nr:FAD-dependent oxidoreductase [Acidimicrobiia bacterium]
MSREPTPVDTIVVGAGISGLGCARRLYESGERFVVISSNIGGRILQSADGAIPLGAFYVRADYDHVNQIVTRGSRLRSRDTLRHDQDGAYTLWNHRLLTHPGQVVRFLLLLNRFRRHYNRLKTNSETRSQAQAIRADPFLHQFYHEPATTTVTDHRFPDLARHYLAPALHGTAFLPLDQLTGFTMLLGALPTIVATYEFTLRWDALLHDLRPMLVTDTVTTITATDGGYTIGTTSGQRWIARNVVVATDITEAQRLLDITHVKKPVQVHMFEIAGDLRPPFTAADVHLFADDETTLAMVARPNQPVLFCTQSPAPDLDRYFTRWDIIEHHDWNPAFNLAGDALLDCQQAPNLYLIGDHNICGLEDAYLTGLYAANQITSRPQQLRPLSPPSS